ncbi:MAG TPA: hypothetical protein VFW25_13970 [Silvibacterium sp.]|nr:hypothetical protein [Silvibacterium sp.]
MPQIRKPGNYIARALCFAAALVIGSSVAAANAQYVGRVDTNQDNKTPSLRATAVLEYTGDLTKPNASRLIPIAVWDGERYQPGGLYMAQPVPLTVESGTQYVLQVAGTPKGLFDVKGAADVSGSWIGIGSYQKPAPPNAAKLRRSRQLPVLVEDDKPHFAHVPAGDTSAGAKPTGTTPQKNAPEVDPDRPTLHRRASDGSGQNTSSASSTGPAPDTAHGPAPDTAADTDPERPTLHRARASSPGGEGTRETATDSVDPDRPRLEHGRPQELESLDTPAVEIKKLAGTPVDLQQIAAVSDAATRQTHSYVYTWIDPEEEKKMQAALENIAEKMVAESAPTTPSAAGKSHATSAGSHAGARSHAVSRRARKPALPALSDEQFKAFELSYGGGATVVFSATSGESDAARYVTLIAEPDFNGTPIILFRQITSERELNVIPRMKLIDAVDTNGDNRAELIFSLENQNGRRYAIYDVANNKAEQVFTTGS